MQKKNIFFNVATCNLLLNTEEEHQIDPNVSYVELASSAVYKFYCEIFNKTYYDDSISRVGVKFFIFYPLEFKPVKQHHFPLLQLFSFF